jgi:dTMP kinase
MQGARPSSWTTMALLFAADRLDHLESEVVPNLLDGVTVITDRYVHSSIAYQSVASDQDEGTISWLREINRHARVPDLTIVLDVEARVASQRRAARNMTRELFDDDDFQKKLCNFYAEIDAHFPGERIVHVDGNKSADDVAASVSAAVRELRGE